MVEEGTRINGRKLQPGDTFGCLKMLEVLPHRQIRWECPHCGRSFCRTIAQAMQAQLDLYGCPDCRKATLKERKKEVLEQELVGKTIHGMRVERIEYRQAAESEERMDGRPRIGKSWQEIKPFAVCTCALCGRECVMQVSALRRKRGEGCKACTCTANAQKVRIIQPTDSGDGVKLHVRTGRNNTSGRTGVSYTAASGMWKAAFGTEILGTYRTFEEAVAAREAAERKALEKAEQDALEKASGQRAGRSEGIPTADSGDGDDAGGRRPPGRAYRIGEQIGEVRITGKAPGGYTIQCTKCGRTFETGAVEIRTAQMDLYGCPECRRAADGTPPPTGWSRRREERELRASELRREYVGKDIAGMHVNDVLTRERTRRNGYLQRWIAFDATCLTCGRRLEVREPVMLRPGRGNGCHYCLSVRTQTGKPRKRRKKPESETE